MRRAPRALQSLRYTSKKHWGQVCREMREIYTAPTVAAAEARFGEFAEQWRERYPAMIDTWFWANSAPDLENSVVIEWARGDLNPHILSDTGT